MQASQILYSELRGNVEGSQLSTPAAAAPATVNVEAVRKGHWDEFSGKVGQPLKREPGDLT